MANLSAAVMAHPVRASNVSELLVQLDRDIPVCYDTVATPSADPIQRWRVARAAWEAHDPDADWHLVLQDDVEVAHNLIAGLEKALDQFDDPAGLMSAYCGTGRPDQASVARALGRATRDGHAWTSTRSLNWGPAIIAPTLSIPSMLNWAERYVRRHRPPKSNTDFAIGVYYRDVKKWRTWYTVPSLVEHRGLPSLVGHDTGPARVAHRFIGTDGDALSVDWSARPPGGLDPYIA